jgi:hypothetical protein
MDGVDVAEPMRGVLVCYAEEVRVLGAGLGNRIEIEIGGRRRPRGVVVKEGTEVEVADAIGVEHTPLLTGQHFYVSDGVS